MNISPQMMISLSEALKKKKKEDDAIGMNLINNTRDSITQGSGILGNLLQATSTIPGQEPNVNQSTFGGALSGLSAGMAFGPFGALMGAAIGGIGGYASGSKNLEEYLTGLNLEQDMNMRSKTVQPTMYDEGGKVTEMGVQTEVGEIILLPHTLELVKAAAKKDHDDMKSNHISDFLPEGSEVFSTKLKINPSLIKDVIIARGAGHYTEAKTYTPEEVKVGDKFGDKEVSFADAAGIIKRKISVVGDDSKDIFDKITDLENKDTRGMYLKVLIEEQNKERNKGNVSPEGIVQMFKYGGKVKRYNDGGTIGEGVSGRYYENVLKKLEELRGKNEETFTRGNEELSDLTRRMRGSIMAQAGVETLFTALQNPNVRPVVQDNTFINEAYQQMPLSFIESQVSPIRGSVNSMAQSLLASGVDPKDIPSMVAGTQGRALDAEGRMRSNFALDRVKTDRDRYAALRGNLVSNRSNIIKAENDTTDNFNKRFSEFGRVIANSIGDNRKISVGDFTGRRTLEKSYNDNDINLFRTQSEIEGKRAEFDDSMSRINERLKRLDLENEKLNRTFDKRLGLHDGVGIARLKPYVDRGQIPLPRNSAFNPLESPVMHLPPRKTLNVESLFSFPVDPIWYMSPNSNTNNGYLERDNSDPWW